MAYNNLEDSLSEGLKAVRDTYDAAAAIPGKVAEDASMRLSRIAGSQSNAPQSQTAATGSALDAVKNKFNQFAGQAVDAGQRFLSPKQLPANPARRDVDPGYANLDTKPLQGFIAESGPKKGQTFAVGAGPGRLGNTERNYAGRTALEEFAEANRIRQGTVDYLKGLNDYEPRIIVPDQAPSAIDQAQQRVSRLYERAYTDPNKNRASALLRQAQGAERDLASLRNVQAGEVGGQNSLARTQLTNEARLREQQLQNEALAGVRGAQQGAYETQQLRNLAEAQPAGAINLNDLFSRFSDLGQGG